MLRHGVFFGAFALIDRHEHERGRFDVTPWKNNETGRGGVVFGFSAAEIVETPRWAAA